MQASLSLICGVLLAAVILVVTRRRRSEAGGSASKPTALGWCTLALGLVAAVAFIIATRRVPLPGDTGGRLFLVSIAFGFAAVVTGIGSLMRRDRHWPTWVGFIAGLASTVFWIWFAAAHLFGTGE